MKKAELERKRELLAEVLGDASSEHRGHLDLLLTAYAEGGKHRREVADNIVAKYRPVLRAHGPNYDGPLFADLMTALGAAESNGTRRMVPVPAPKAKALFNINEVQGCLLCGTEYRPAVDSSVCPHAAVPEK